jgi:hypothetical protein
MRERWEAGWGMFPMPWSEDDEVEIRSWVGKYLEGGGRVLFGGIVPAFACRDWGKLWEFSLKTADNHACNWSHYSSRYCSTNLGAADVFCSSSWILTSHIQKSSFSFEGFLFIGLNDERTFDLQILKIGLLFSLLTSLYLFITFC